jgi:anti-anti-sigma regulatory factor
MPTFTETVNLRTGLIRATGHLTVQGADLLGGTADSLRAGGHTRVTLDLTGVRDADAEGLDLLRHLGAAFAAEGSELVVRHRPRPAPPA